MKKILFLLILATSSLSAQINNGLIAKYYFNNGTAIDDLGNIPGVENNASLTTDRFGCANQAYHFNPADSAFIDLGDNFDGATTGSSAEFSISIWFRRTDLNHKNEFLLSKYGNTLCGDEEREYLLRI